MKPYDVYITRVERYQYVVKGVEAPDARTAKAIVRKRDESNEFENVWNELCPEVDTTYDAYDKEGVGL